MITHFLVLLLAAVSWVAALWLLIQPDFAKWSNPAVIALHAVPPLVVSMLWFALRRRAQKKAAAEAQEKEASAQAERVAAREAAQKKHAEELRQRRFACDCRAVAIAGLVATSDLPLVDAEHPNIDIGQQVRNPDNAVERVGASILDLLTPAITDALSKVYSVSPAALVFPIYVSPPAEISGEEVLARIRAIHADLAETFEPGVNSPIAAPAVLFLPSGDGAANSVISLFEGTPDLPGAVVLAFDSPFSRNAQNDPLDDEATPEQARKEQWSGKPGEGVIALLLTNAELPSMLATIGEMDSGAEHDSMTPFWEKSLQPGGNLALLVSVSAASRGELAALPVLGRIHRAAFRPAAQSRTGVLEMTRLIQAALERAQVNAGVIDPPFSFDDVAADSPKEEQEVEKKTSCGWIVHNAGGVDVAGKRLAALGSSLYYFGIDLSPVDADAATNFITRVGDLGKAAGVGQLALGVAQAARQAGPVLCAEYSGEDGIAVSFIMQLPSNA